MSPDPDSRSENDEGRSLRKVARGYLLINYPDHRNGGADYQERERQRKRLAAQKRRAEERAELDDAELEAPPLAPPEPVTRPDGKKLDVTKAAAGPVADDPWQGSEAITSCPLDLVQRAKSVGVFKHMAERLKVHESSIEDKAREFVTYWTIGGGMGRTKKLWMRALREDIRRAAEQGKLKAPGEILHHAQAPPPTERERTRRPAAEPARLTRQEERRREAETNARAGFGPPGTPLTPRFHLPGDPAERAPPAERPKWNHNPQEALASLLESFGPAPP